MGSSKQPRRSKKKEELPSFLVGLTAPPEDILIAPKPTPSLKYLGPIFFGECSGYQHHPPPHSLKLGSFHQPQYGMLPGHDSASKLLYPPMKVERDIKTIKTFTPKLKRQKVFHDAYLHRSPGVNKKFIPETHSHVVDLGKTQSIIEGEIAIEMPLCRVSSRGYKVKSGSKPKVEFTTFSDIREKNRMYMSYKERIAHAHFPKEFATVRIIGPPIPASITITKLPSKRKARPELTLEAKPKEEEEETVKESKEEKDEAEETALSVASSGAEETEKSETSDMKIEVGSSESVSKRERMDEQEKGEKEEDWMEEGEGGEEERQEEEMQKEEKQGEEGEEEGQKEEEQKEEGQREESPKEEQPAEESPKEEQPAEEGPKEEQPAEESLKEEQPAEESPKEEQPAEEGPKEEQPTEEGPKEEQPTEEGPKEEQPPKEDPKEEQPPKEGQKEKENDEEGEGEVVNYGEDLENESIESDEEND